jgi:hypothetical protein
MRAFAGLLVFVLLGFSAWWAVSQRGSTDLTILPVLPKPRPVDRETKPLAPVPAMASTISRSSHDPRTSRNKLLADLNQSRSIRAFIHRALQDPDNGGLSYASEAMSNCKETTAAREPSDDINVQHARALLDARCDMSFDEYWQELRLAINADAMARDPFVRVVTTLLESNADPEGAKRIAARALLNSSDPVAMNHLLRLNVGAEATSDGNQAAFFNGVWYRDEMQRRRLEDAWSLTRCQFGFDCSSDSATALRLCAERSWCGSTVSDAMAQGYQRTGDGGGVAELSVQLAQAIRSQRIEAFVSREMPAR